MIYGGGSRKHTFISAGDVAAFTVAAVHHPAAQNQFLPLGGPIALTWREVIATYEHVLRHPIAAEFVPLGTPVPYLPEAMLGLFAALDTFDSMIDTTDLANTFMVRLTPLEEVVQRMLEPVHA